MATMPMLVELDVPHRSAALANGHTVLVFSNITLRNQAAPLLEAAGFVVNDAGPRGLRISRPWTPKTPWRARHPRMFRALVVTLLLLVLPVWPVSGPLFTILVVRWYRRTRPSLPFRVTLRVQRVHS